MYTRRQFALTAAMLSSSAISGRAMAVPMHAITPLRSQNLMGMTASEIASGYGTGSHSPVEVTSKMLDDIELSQGSVNAYAYIDREGALKAARASEKRWMSKRPLGQIDGVPMAFKDQYHVADMPMRLGSRLRSASPLDSDEPVVDRFRQAGAVFLGKTTQPEEGSLATGVSGLYGVTRNPLDLSKSVGGSSGGAAAAGAAGLGPIQMAADGGGSIRTPASYCAMVGFKPTPGVIPRTGDPEYAVYGPITATVGDAQLALKAAAPSTFQDLTRFDPKGMKIAYLPFSGAGLPPTTEIRAATDVAVQTLRAAGVQIDVIEPMVPGDILPRIAGMFYLNDVFETLASHPLNVQKSNVSQLRYSLVEAISKLDADTVLADGQKAMGELATALLQHPINDYDFVISPTMPTPLHAAENGWPIEAEASPNFAMQKERYGGTQEHQLHLVIGTFLGLPEITLPLAAPAQSPIGLLLSGKRQEDTKLLTFAKWVEERLL